ncbi:4-alpha-glucanotransferase [Hydrogenimonas sp. SS33]|uniref:4-alpha-glucanotransferase n=1 Tax=Hydrogenimonas leucolamina TaxID=2954236 RepID=UPI00336BBC9E
MAEKRVLKDRMSGILLHPTSLPGECGIGDIGENAMRWVEKLSTSGVSLWQMLPLGPTGFGDSPYQSFSAFAGNPLLVDLQPLRDAGWLVQEKRASEPETARVDYEKSRSCKLPKLQEAFVNFTANAKAEEKEDFHLFCDREKGWLEDFALFMALRKAQGDRPWYRWEEKLRKREPSALREAARAHEEEVAYQKFLQYLFDRQWKSLKHFANERGVYIVGDIPIYVSEDSADVWAHPGLFDLDEKGLPRHVAGVPPDYFSPTGQRWGNPLYDWEAMRRQGYAWWIDRFKKSFELYDVVRIDHFRGFEAYWAIPSEEETAVKGRWVEGPGAPFFEAVERALGKLPIIAEDLGIITPEVERLRESLGFPGMKILQFAFDGNAANPYLPHNHTRNAVVYTGTHDNDTTVGWFESLPDPRKVTGYLASSEKEIQWAMIREALKSVAATAVFPMQDLLGLGSWARMNLPGSTEGNWRWRMTQAQMEEAAWQKLASLNRLYWR